jgi:aminoglycoside phosphotransferase (APT) family kinase protein
LYSEKTQKITAWLDWELAVLGDRHQDLAWGAELDDAIERADAPLSDSSADAVILDGTRVQLLSCIEAAVAQASGSPSEQAVARAVIVGSRPQFDLARAFCRPAGFDGHSDEMRTLTQLLQG